MITFNTQEEFEDAVIGILQQRLELRGTEKRAFYGAQSTEIDLVLTPQVRPYETRWGESEILSTITIDHPNTGHSPY